MIDYYILNGREIVPATLMGWAKWYEKNSRRVALDFVGEYRVSTVFLGLNHSFGKGPPILFETMVFPKESFSNRYMDRYSTYDEAEKGHAEIVARLKAGTLKMYNLKE